MTVGGDERVLTRGPDGQISTVVISTLRGWLVSTSLSNSNEWSFNSTFESF